MVSADAYCCQCTGEKKTVVLLSFERKWGALLMPSVELGGKAEMKWNNLAMDVCGMTYRYSGASKP